MPFFFGGGGGGGTVIMHYSHVSIPNKYILKA